MPSVAGCPCAVLHLMEQRLFQDKSSGMRQGDLLRGKCSKKDATCSHIMRWTPAFA